MDTTLEHFKVTLTVTRDEIERAAAETTETQKLLFSIGPGPQ